MPMGGFQGFWRLSFYYKSPFITTKAYQNIDFFGAILQTNAKIRGKQTQAYAARQIIMMMIQQDFFEFYQV